MTAYRNSRRKRGFTLVELLTVVGIIALLIGILIPSLSKARAQAKKVKVSAQLSSTEKGLEMFRNDFGDYPDSSAGTPSNKKLDPILNYPGKGTGSDPDRLWGAHWLARALAGFDLQGVDAKGYTLMGRDSVKYDSGKKQMVTGQSGGFNVDVLLDPTEANLDRKGVYMEGNSIWMRDTDTKLPQAGSPATGRPVMIDTFNFPIIYYKANVRARKPFSVTGESSDNSGGVAGLGVYNREDNFAITGDSTTTNKGWQLAPGGQHPLGNFEDTDYNGAGATVHDPKRNFIDYLHSEAVHELSTSSFPQIKPLNPETFVLISPGFDGLYGTEDDVTNFKSQ